MFISTWIKCTDEKKHSDSSNRKKHFILIHFFCLSMHRLNRLEFIHMPSKYWTVLRAKTVNSFNSSVYMMHVYRYCASFIFIARDSMKCSYFHTHTPKERKKTKNNCYKIYQLLFKHRYFIVSSTVCSTSNRMRMVLMAMKSANWLQLRFMYQQCSPILNVVTQFSLKLCIEAI